MEDDQPSVTVGCQVARWKRELLREHAFQQRTTMSALLRDRVDDILEEADVDKSDISEVEVGANK